MIRSAIKYFLINSVTLYIVSLFVSGITFTNGLNTLLLTGIALTIAALVIKPVINVLLLPINLLTFGLFRWVGYAVALYIVTIIVPNFKLESFVFNGFNSYWFNIPSITLSGFLAFIAFSFLISLIASIAHWIFK